ncbi:uncharacterized protein [Nicotiana sylvestris]|uniref:uncharacterized protein n=1 Tax=Nicotiana sylvestris TaxID=4096 RepID=UPI00388C7663
MPFGEVGDMNNFISCFKVSLGELRDAQEADAVKVEISLQGGGRLASISDGVSDSVGYDFPGVVKAAEKFMRHVIAIFCAFLLVLGIILCHSNFSAMPQCKDMYDHTFLRLHKEPSYHEKECKKLTLMLRDSDALPIREEKDLGELRAALETALREKVDLAVKVEQNGSQLSQLYKEISGLRKQSEVATEELATSQDLLRNARKEVAALATAKSKVERNATIDLEDATTTHKIARDVSIAAQQKLARDIIHVKVDARRETLEEIGAIGVDLSADLEGARELERELVLLIAHDEGEESSDEESTSFSSYSIVAMIVTSMSDSGVERSSSYDLHLAFDKLKSELLRSEAPLRETLDREKFLKILCTEKKNKQVSLRREVDRNRSHVIRLEKQIVSANDSVLANMIARLSSKLLKAKT